MRSSPICHKHIVNCRGQHFHKDTENGSTFKDTLAYENCWLVDSFIKKNESGDNKETNFLKQK